MKKLLDCFITTTLIDSMTLSG